MTNYQNIPAEMRARKRWLVHKLVPDGEKLQKIPHSLKDYPTGCKKEAEWVTFEQACSAVAAGKFDGISYVLTGDDGLTCVDLDHACPESGQEPEPWAKRIIEELDSYTERSQSGTGFHIFVRASIPKNSHKKDSKVELYSTVKIIAMTGDVDDFHLYIGERDLTSLFTRAEAGEFSPQPLAAAVPTPTSTGDDSADDFAAACNAARKCGCDFEKTKAEFRRTAKQRPKLQRAAYVDGTVKNAIAEVLTSQPMVKPKEAPSQPASEPASEKHWREVFHTGSELDTTPGKVFIKGILEEGITFFGAHSGVGKGRTHGSNRCSPDRACDTASAARCVL